VGSRGGGTRLITKEGRGFLTKKEMKDVYGWVCTESLFESTSAVNMNEVEKQVQKLLHEDDRSIWTRTRRCSSSRCASFMGPVANPNGSGVCKEKLMHFFLHFIHVDSTSGLVDG